jgi:predicted dehydrogenase
MAKPIRVGFIGLSATGSGWANYAHLPYLKQSSDFKIVALCNSSVEAAERAVKAFNFPPETKTYGSPEDLANDEAVDLVVVSVRVDKHAEVALPSLRKGKDVLCEWPMDRNYDVAKQMRDAAKQGGGRTVVAAQGGVEPAVQKLKSLIDEGKIGRVLSSTFVAAINAGGTDQDVEMRYFLDRKIGGNILSIGFGHSKSIS